MAAPTHLELMQTAAPSHPRLDFIDCLRGVAVSGVVLVHTGQIIFGLPPWLVSLTAYGGYGVELFFMLSALTLLFVYKSRHERLSGFFVRRLFRIAPLFYAGAVFYLLLNGTGAQMPYAPEGIQLRSIMLTFAFLHGWDPASFNAIVPGGWSIADEMMFYLVFPFLLAFIKDGRRALIAAIAVFIVSRLVFVLVPLWLESTAMHIYPLKVFAGFLFPAQLPAFLCGFLAYFVIQRAHVAGKVPSTKLSGMALLIMSGVLLTVSMSGQKSLTNYLLADVLILGFVLAVWASQHVLIVNAVFRRLGILSYSIYITHFSAVMLAHKMLLPHLQDMPSTGQLAVMYGAIYLIAIGISCGTYALIEKPGIALGRRLSRIGPSRLV
jgi:peptidoglycan/LPS O-acetylase OafA/YrhL